MAAGKVQQREGYAGPGLDEPLDVVEAEQVCPLDSFEVLGELGPRQSEGVSIASRSSARSEFSDVDEDRCPNGHRRCTRRKNYDSARLGFDRASSEFDRLGAAEDRLREATLVSRRPFSVELLADVIDAPTALGAVNAQLAWDTTRTS